MLGKVTQLTILFWATSAAAVDAENFSTDVGEARSGYSDQHHHHGNPQHVIHTTHHAHHGGGHGGHGHGHAGHFSHFFDIALTALAFLAFGVFLLNLLLNALAGLTTTTTTMMAVLPTNTGTGIITNTATQTGGRSRTRREAFDLHLNKYVSVEALAASVLTSIDAMVHEHECLDKVFCDGNKQAKVIGSGFQYMMPAYSLGASFIGKRAGFHNSFTEHLKSVALGVGEANCQAHFPQC